MRLLILLTLCFCVSFAELLDFRVIEDAKVRYRNKDYNNAIKLYSKVKHKKGAMFNLANSYFKVGNYEKALEVYLEIDDDFLEFQRLYNMGNTYAKLGEIDKSIQSYEAAMKIQKDDDIKYNLILLKKIQKQKLGKRYSTGMDKKGKSNEKKDDKEVVDNDKTLLEFNNEDIVKKSKNGMGNREKQSQDKYNTLKRESNSKAIKSAKDIEVDSVVAHRKYNRMLNQNEVHTLMLPLSKKEEVENEENPW